MIKSLWLRKYKLSGISKRGGKCVDLNVCMGYLQMHTQEVEKINERWSYTNRKSRLIEIIVDDLCLHRGAVASVVVKASVLHRGLLL